MRDPGIPTLSTLRADMQAETALRVHVMQPAKILAYDDVKSTARIELGFQEVVADRDGVERVTPARIVDDVPVVQLGGATAYVRVPLTPGTTGVAMVMDRSMGSWRATGAAGEPPIPGAHTLADLVFLPGLRPNSAPLAPATLGGIVIEATAIQLGVGAVQSTLLGTVFSALWTSLFAALNAHTHPFIGLAPAVPGITAPSADLPIALSTIPPLSTALTAKVKVQ